MYVYSYMIFMVAKIQVSCTVCLDTCFCVQTCMCVIFSYFAENGLNSLTQSQLRNTS